MCRGISWCVPGWVALQHSKHHHKSQTSTRSPTRQAEAACLCGCLPAWVVAWGAWVLQLSAHRHLKSMSAPQWKVCISPQRAHWGYREGSDPPGSPLLPSPLLRQPQDKCILHEKRKMAPLWGRKAE